MSEKDIILIDLIDDDKPIEPLRPSLKVVEMVTVNEDANLFAVTINDVPRRSTFYGDFCLIRSSLHDLITRCSFATSYEWLYSDNNLLRSPVLSFQSRKYPARKYKLKLYFPEDFPESPVTIEPMVLLPGLEFCVISSHPFLSMRLWSASNNLLEVFHGVLYHLESQTYNFSNISEPLVGGKYESGMLFHSHSNATTTSSDEDEITLEYLIAELYHQYSFELHTSFHSALDKLREKLIPSDLCVCLGTLHSGETDKRSKTGTGYSYGHEHFYQQQQKKAANQQQQTFSSSDSKMKRLVQLIANRLSVAIPLPSTLYSSKSSQKEHVIEPKMMVLYEWLLTCPLVDLLHHILKECSKEELYRLSSPVGGSCFLAQLVGILLRCEFAYHRYNEARPYKEALAVQAKNDFIDLLDDDDNGKVEEGTIAETQDISIQRRQELMGHFQTLYQRIYQGEKDEIYDTTGRQALKWLKELSVHSRYFQQIKETGARNTSSSSSSSSSNSSSSSSGGELNQQVAATDSANNSTQRVYHLHGVEQRHVFYPVNAGSSSSSHNTRIEAVSKHWMRGSKFIEENLPEEITLFVSEDHPNYIIANLFIHQHEDNPYLGGSFLFHIMIPHAYPKVSPKVQLVTTGEGTVRFNPNLYNCGKVCLSLLGTWAGEPWNPTNSNLTQVLKSILYLIFTDEPYYNEPGYMPPPNHLKIIEQPTEEEADNNNQGKQNEGFLPMAMAVITAPFSKKSSSTSSSSIANNSSNSNGYLNYHLYSPSLLQPHMQSLQYNLAILQNTLRHAILSHLQAAPTKYGPKDIQEFILRECYMKHWYGKNGLRSRLLTHYRNHPLMTQPIFMQMQKRVAEIDAKVPYSAPVEQSTTTNASSKKKRKLEDDEVQIL